MSPMKEKRPMKSDAEREPGRGTPRRKDDRPERPETEARARKLAERHRETLDYLSKN
jgi:hypothetical protein